MIDALWCSRDANARVKRIPGRTERKRTRNEHAYASPDALNEASVTTVYEAIAKELDTVGLRVAVMALSPGDRGELDVVLVITRSGRCAENAALSKRGLLLTVIPAPA